MKILNKISRYKTIVQIKWLLNKEKRLIEQDRKEKRLIARVFNERYCIADRHDRTDDSYVDGDLGFFGLRPKKGNRWMCPSCNRIHAPIRNSLWTGLQYPACCEFEEGSRHDDLSKNSCLKRPFGFYGTEGMSFKLEKLGIVSRLNDYLKERDQR